MSKILFHPEITAAEALRIAQAQGGRLVWRGVRERITTAQRDVERAAIAAQSQHYLPALDHIRAADSAIASIQKEAKPCA